MSANSDLTSLTIGITEFFDINCVSNFEPNETAINNLVMNDSHLRMVKILTERYNDQDLRRDGAWSADFIQSKGEGQIFLLHGPPGVGKTYTAECIAETSRKWYPIINKVQRKILKVLVRPSFACLDLRRHRSVFL